MNHISLHDKARPRMLHTAQDVFQYTRQVMQDSLDVSQAQTFCSEFSYSSNSVRQNPEWTITEYCMYYNTSFPS